MTEKATDTFDFAAEAACADTADEVRILVVRELVNRGSSDNTALIVLGLIYVGDSIHELKRVLGTK